jgi:hypothetical protein
VKEATKKPEESHPDLDDPIDVTMHARKKLGGEGVIIEAEARKQKLNVPKALKLVAKGAEQVELIQED